MESDSSLPQTSSSEANQEQLTTPPQSQSSSPRSPTSSNISEHESSFAFPKLALDGSLSDLPSRSPYPPTPPAALSSLGAKAMMAGHTSDSLSEASLDAQYDMIDDISDLSDGHETASLTSTRPDDEDEHTLGESMVDLDAELGIRRPTRDAQTNTQVKAENALLDSYMSEDLETPRQSTLHNARARRTTLGPPSASSPATTITKSTYHILFVSDRSTSNDAVSDACLRFASCLLPADENMEETIASIGVGATPGHLSSTHLSVRLGDVELAVELCVDAQFVAGDDRKPELAYFFRYPDGDDVSMSNLADKQSIAPSDLYDLVVYYLHDSTYPDWHNIVKSNMLPMMPPAITLSAPGVELSTPPGIEKEELFESELVLSSDELFGEDDGHVREAIRDLMTEHARMPTTQSKATNASSDWLQCVQKEFGLKYPTRQDFRSISLWHLLTFIAVVLAYFIKPYLHILDGPDPSLAVAMRREAFASALTKMTNSTDTAMALNMTYLIPYHEAAWKDEELAPPQARYEHLPPNHFIISLPEKTNLVWHQLNWNRFPHVVSSTASRSNTSIEHNLTQLIDGVYDVTIRPEDASGKVTVNLYAKWPKLPERDIVVEHNFGMRILHRDTYDKISTDLSKTIGKEVMVARKNAKSLGSKMSLELSAGAAATRNVTTEVAIYIVRDLTIMANTALSVFTKAAAASNGTAANFKKELAAVQKDLIQLSNDVQKSLISRAHTAKALIPYMHAPVKRVKAWVPSTQASVKSVKALIPSMKTLKRPLALSRERAMRIKKALAGHRDANSTSATKELSLRLQNIFGKPTEKSKKAGSFADIARCSQAKDYQACRREQKALQARESKLHGLASVSAASKSTVPSQAPEADVKASAGKKEKKIGKKGKKGKKAAAPKDARVEKDKKKNKGPKKHGKKHKAPGPK
ncbi:hypothetical protein BDY17DRAFT_291343 [Neohortaea acidophila]|uniref:Uncharacterized protein n=1 Tax=Neohortaea acidophila TaxID=245834 RepID=A0A6A6Q2X7_9PEZI|nr:uncharacterized protein BDY17DRAFT_291343 [Neohortaea acidophila]KAF2486359.1 hypothetical protein BDY17DRAFT_291343 [Neohortaea acidophila]